MFLKEFLAYKILYQILCGMDMETQRIMRALTKDDLEQEPIKHAL